VAFLSGGARGIAHVSPDAERAVSGARENDDADGIIIRRCLKRPAQLFDRLRTKGIQPLGPVDGDGGTAFIDLVKNIFELQGPPRCRQAVARNPSRGGQEEVSLLDEILVRLSASLVA
jgi:hypothetical protein